MYIEYSKGIIEVICGPMFSGKSDELIKRIKILKYSNVPTLVIKPSIDTRWNKNKIFSRSGSAIDAISIDKFQNMEVQINQNKYKAIAIDEIQFFDNEIVAWIMKLSKRGIRIIASGLDKDFLGNPFGPMPQLLAISDIVYKKFAICLVCGNAATMTYRKSNNKNQIEIGDDQYEPRCRQCYNAKI